MKITKEVFLLLILLTSINHRSNGQFKQFIIGMDFFDQSSVANPTDWMNDGTGIPAPCGSASMGNTHPYYAFLSKMYNNYHINTVNFIRNAMITPQQCTDFLSISKNIGLDVFVLPPNYDFSSSRLDAYTNAAGDKLNGLYIADEVNNPYYAPVEQLSGVSINAELVRNYNPNLLRWANALPCHAYGTNDYYYREEYLESIISTLKPNIISFDHYPIGNTNNGHINQDFFRGLYTFGSKSTIHSVPFAFVTTPFSKVYDGYDQWYQNQNMFKQTKTLSQFNYENYCALIYGAKGILYWPGFTWAVDPNGRIPFKLNIDESVYNSLGAFHKLIAENSSKLLKLNFASAYHYSTQSTIHKKGEAMQYWSIWNGNNLDRVGAGFSRDPYAQFIFSDLSFPITLLPTTGSDNDIYNNHGDFAFSFMTDENNGIYFWVMNKGLNWGHKFSVKLNTNNVNSITDVLTPSNGTSVISLNPGEAKLFKVNKSNPSSKITVNICNKTYGYSNDSYYSNFNTSPLVTADNINIGGTGCVVTFEDSTYSSFMAHNIRIGKGTHMMKGSHVHLKKYTNSNTIPSGMAKVSKQYIDDGESGEIKKKEETDGNTVSVFPNPTYSDFIVALTLQEGERTVISVYDSMGKLAKTQTAAGSETTISLADFPAGVYVVRFNADGKEHHYKVVKM